LATSVGGIIQMTILLAHYSLPRRVISVNFNTTWRRLGDADRNYLESDTKIG
jgi:hypothetical protein